MPFFFPPRSLRIPARELGPARGILPVDPAPRVSRGGVGNAPAGYVPGLPLGMAGIPEFEYWHDPVTGELWSRPRFTGPTQVIPARPGTLAGRRAQAAIFDRENERTPAPRGVGPSGRGAVGPGGLGNVAGNQIDNQIQRGVLSGGGIDIFQTIANVLGAAWNVVGRPALGTVIGPAAALAPPARIGTIIARKPPVTTMIAQPQPAGRPTEGPELIAGRDPATFEYGLEVSRGGVTEIEAGVGRGMVETVRGARPFEFDLPFPEVGLGD